MDKARARKQGGTGLGLAISKVVKALGGLSGLLVLKIMVRRFISVYLMNRLRRMVGLKYLVGFVYVWLH